MQLNGSRLRKLRGHLSLSKVAPKYRGGASVMRCSQIERTRKVSSDVFCDYLSAIGEALKEAKAEEAETEAMIEAAIQGLQESSPGR